MSGSGPSRPASSAFARRRGWLRVSDVLNRGGIDLHTGLPITDADLGVTCPSCRQDQGLHACTLTPADDHIADVTRYTCVNGCDDLARTGHWGMHEQPLQWSRYRLGDYVIEARADLHLRAGKGWAVLPSDPTVDHDSHE